MSLKVAKNLIQLKDINLHHKVVLCSCANARVSWGFLGSGRDEGREMERTHTHGFVCFSLSHIRAWIRWFTACVFLESGVGQPERVKTRSMEKLFLTETNFCIFTTWLKNWIIGHELRRLLLRFPKCLSTPSNSRCGHGSCNQRWLYEHINGLEAFSCGLHVYTGRSAFTLVLFCYGTISAAEGSHGCNVSALRFPAAACQSNSSGWEGDGVSRIYFWWQFAFCVGGALSICRATPSAALWGASLVVIITNLFYNKHTRTVKSVISCLGGRKRLPYIS